MRVPVSFRHSIRRSQTVNMNSISVIKPHACRLCSKAFTRKYTLHRHVENMHAEEQSTDGEENTETCEMVYSPGSEYEPLHKKRRCMSPEHSDESSEEDDSESESENNAESADDNDDEDEQSSSDLEDNTAYQD